MHLMREWMTPLRWNLDGPLDPTGERRSSSVTQHPLLVTEMCMVLPIFASGPVPPTESKNRAEADKLKGWRQEG